MENRESLLVQHLRDLRDQTLALRGPFEQLTNWFSRTTGSQR